LEKQEKGIVISDKLKVVSDKKRKLKMIGHRATWRSSIQSRTLSGLQVVDIQFPSFGKGGVRGGLVIFFKTGEWKIANHPGFATPPLEGGELTAKNLDFRFSLRLWAFGVS